MSGESSKSSNVPTKSSPLPSASLINRGSSHVQERLGEVDWAGKQSHAEEPLHVRRDVVPSTACRATPVGAVAVSHCVSRGFVVLPGCRSV